MMMMIYRKWLLNRSTGSLPYQTVAAAATANGTGTGVLKKNNVEDRLVSKVIHTYLGSLLFSPPLTHMS